MTTTTLVVGTPGEDTLGNDVGAAYLFNVGTGGLIDTIDNPTPIAGDAFGSDVAIFGTKAVVGAKGDDTGARMLALLTFSVRSTAAYCARSTILHPKPMSISEVLWRSPTIARPSAPRSTIAGVQRQALRTYSTPLRVDCC